jgi:hypothetical protein
LSLRFVSTALAPPGFAVNPIVADAPGASVAFQLAAFTVYVAPCRPAIVPFHRLEIVPAKSNDTLQFDSVAVPVFFTVMSPLKPEPQSLVTLN